jgi:hypothetical protein
MSKIPKIAHFVYTNRSPISWLQVLSVRSFHKYNPDWEIRLYLISQTPDELRKNTDVPDCPDYMDTLIVLPYLKIIFVDLDEWNIRKDIHGLMASDIIRCRLMYEVGGVYSDFDMIWLRPMRDFFRQHGSDFETSVCIHENGHYNMSNIISEPGGDFMRSTLIAQMNVGEINDYQCMNSVLFRQYWPTREILLKRFPRLLIIDYETLYPYSVYELERLYNNIDLSVLNDRRVIGLHWFCGHQLSKDYINSEDYTRECSMTEILKREDWK